MLRRLLSILLVPLSVAASAAPSSDPLADALRTLETGRHQQGVQMLTPLANGGNALAQYRLGMLYYHGQGIGEDEKMAIYWWKKAAAQGNVESMFQLGSAFLFGSQTAKFVPDPDREAAMWYFQAASAGHAEAQYHLGLLFLAGKGVVENRQESARWMQKAAMQGHPEAKKALPKIDTSR